MDKSDVKRRCWMKKLGHERCRKKYCETWNFLMLVLLVTMRIIRRESGIRKKIREFKVIPQNITLKEYQKQKESVTYYK
jgi:hypothetical protein